VRQFDQVITESGGKTMLFMTYPNIFQSFRPNIAQYTAVSDETVMNYESAAKLIPHHQPVDDGSQDHHRGRRGRGEAACWRAGTGDAARVINRSLTAGGTVGLAELFA
jgi:hypothetical protein